MSSSSKFGKILAILAVAVVFGGLFGWWLSRQGGMGSVDLSHIKTTGAAASGNSSSDTNTIAGALTAPITETNMIVVPTDTNPDEEKKAAPGWDEKLDAVILGPETEAQKVDKLVALMKTAPPEVELEYSQHLINFVQDDNYGPAAGILTNSTTPSSVSTVLMNDLLNRANTLKLPMLLAVASAEDHSLKGEAKEMLELFIQEDHGTNWTEWSEAIDKWLKENQQ